MIVVTTGAIFFVHLFATCLDQLTKRREYQVVRLEDLARTALCVQLRLKFPYYVLKIKNDSY
jgi:hypothetical protein